MATKSYVFFKDFIEGSGSGPRSPKNTAQDYLLLDSLIHVALTWRVAGIVDTESRHEVGEAPDGPAEGGGGSWDVEQAGRGQQNGCQKHQLQLLASVKQNKMLKAN